MDQDIANTLARELADAIAAAVAADARVESCHARAREAGIELKVVLATEARPRDVASAADATPDGAPTADVAASTHPASQQHATADTMSPADRKFLKALRISAGQPPLGR